MRALQYREIGRAPEVVDVPDPTVGPGQVLLRVTAAGACHSDAYITSRTAEQYVFGPLPLTLGHECAGVVADVGTGVDQVSVGEPVLVYAPWGCGSCRNCARGKKNYCLRPGGARPPGIAGPGAMAEYLLVDDQRHLVPLGDLDPVAHVALTDAGLTPYHAVKRSLPRLGAGSVAVVIGVGGLGHVAVQVIRALSGAVVVALDVTEEKLELARQVGAHHTLLSDRGAARAVRELSDGLGANAVFDFVGAEATLALAGRVAAIEGEVSIVGVGEAALPVRVGSPAHDVAVRAPYWGSRAELLEVVEMARRGQVHVEIETFSLEDAPVAYERLTQGRVRGRAVVLPHG
jgi:alcohol dehydrogenase, propanol-preferring